MDDDIIRLSKVEAGSGRRSAHLPEEENPFEFTIESITREIGRDSGKAYLNVKLKVKSGARKGKVVYSTCSLKPEALWNLKNMLISAGLSSLAEKDLRTAQIIKSATGRTLLANVVDDEYQGKVKSVIEDWVVEERPRRSKRQEVDDEDEEDEEEGDEDEDDDDLDDDEEEDEEEEEEEPAPVKRKSATAKSKTTQKPAAKKKPARASRGRSRDTSDDDDEDLDDLELDDI
jgi:hypothetical protein